MKFKLGETLKDKITGFVGVAFGKTEYFGKCAHYYAGCTHYGLCPEELQKSSKNKTLHWEWFDETRLIKVKKLQKNRKKIKKIGEEKLCLTYYLSF